jgi:hypothetical protein
MEYRCGVCACLNIGMPMPDQRNNSGAMFKNRRKRQGHFDPDYTGSARVNGIDYWLSGWVRTPNDKPDGEKYLSISYKPKEPQRARAQAKENPLDGELW